MAFISAQDKGVEAHQAKNGKLEMNLQYVRSVRDMFPKGSKNWKTSNDILENSMDRMEVTNNQLNLLSYLLTKVK